MATGFAKPTTHPGHLNWSVEELRHDKTKLLETLQEFRYAAHHNWEFLDDVTKFMHETKNQQDPMGSLIERFKTPLAKAAANRKMNSHADIQKKLFNERHPLAEFDAMGACADDFETQKAETQKMLEQARIQKEQEEAQRESQNKARLREQEQHQQKEREMELERQRVSKEQQLKEERQRFERERREYEEREKAQKEQEDLARKVQEEEQRWQQQQHEEEEEKREERQDREEYEAKGDHTMLDANPSSPKKSSIEEDAGSVSSESSSPNIPAPVRKSSLNLASLPAREPVRKSSGRQSPLKHVKNKFSTILKNGRGLLASSAAVSAEAKASVLSSDHASTEASRPASVLSKTPSAEFRALLSTNASTSTLHLSGKHGAGLKMKAHASEENLKKREETLKKEREEHTKKRMKEIEEESRRQEQRLQSARQEQQRRAAERAQAEEKERKKQEKGQKRRISTEINRGLDEFAARMAARDNDNKLKEIQRQREETEKAKASKERVERQQRIFAVGQNTKHQEAVSAHKSQMLRPQSSTKILMPSQERQKRIVEEHRTRIEPPRPQQAPKHTRPSLKHQASQDQVGSNSKRMRMSKEPESQQPSRLKGPPIRPSGGAKKPMGWSSNEIGSQSTMQPPASNAPKPGKVAHPMDMAKISKAPIPFAPNPNPAGPAFKTPGRPEPATMATIKSAHRPSPSQFQGGDAIDLPEIFTDDEDEDYDDALIPSWANTPNITEQLLRQEAINPMKIFGQPQPLDMEKVFEKSKDRFTLFRKRTSSANWSSGDQLTVDEIRKDLAARKKMRKDGGWTMDMAHQMS